MSTKLWKRTNEECTRSDEILWSDEWYTLTPWELEGKTLPYFGRLEKDCGEGKVFTLITVGPFAYMKAEIKEEVA